MIKKGIKKGQVTIFIILAVVIVGASVGYFVLKDSFSDINIPSSFEPVYNSFLTCLEDNALVGIDVLESQGGYISLPDFESGSKYMPFSSELSFLGNPIPYWYYVSGNNIPKQQVPSKRNMETELADFIEGELTDCIFEDYYGQGFEIVLGDLNVDVDIAESSVLVNLNSDLSIAKGDENVVVKKHKIDVDSELGKLYDSAVSVYNYEQDELFLENYGVDILRNYVPVTGVELSCSPKTWSAEDIFDRLQDAIEANTLALKVKGGDYSLRNKDNEYFVIDVPVSGVDVGFVNSKNWANGFEVDPSQGAVLLSKPVGNQPGLGALGFCYVPYHFVYNMRYPVLVQIFAKDSDEIFQFPLAVVIQGNKPRKALDSNAFEISAPELCEDKNTLVEVNVYDSNLNPIEADISYECFGQVCEIGKASSLETEFPQCVNGFVLTKADGFKDTKELFSSVEAGEVNVFMDKLYEKNVQLKLDGVNYNKDAIISFNFEDGVRTIVYPEQKSVELSEGQYEVQVYIQKNSSLRLESTISEQCTEVPKSGLGGLFGLNEKKCFSIEIPEQIISNVLVGGGKENYYVLESELKNSGVIEIDVQSLPTPSSLERLQNNYLLFEERGLDLSFE